MNEKEDFDPVEELNKIRMLENRYIIELMRSGQLKRYIHALHQEMLEKYPEMIVRVISDDDMEREQ